MRALVCRFGTGSERGFVMTRKTSVSAIVVASLLASPCGLWAEDVPSLEPGVTVRLTGGDDAAIPGVGEVVVNDEQMVAVRVPGQEERAAVLRPGRQMVGELREADDETILIRPDGRDQTYRVRRSALAQFEVRRGWRPGKRLGIGAAVGAVAGVVIGGVIGYQVRAPLTTEDWETGRHHTDWYHGLGALEGGVVGALAGGLTGALVGLGSFHQYWVPLAPKAPKRLSLGLQPVPKGVGVSLRYGF
jgi:hypothetical protein